MGALLEATGENTRSKALERTAEFYPQMRGENPAVPNGAFEELMTTAERQGSVTPEEIAEIPDTDSVPVWAETHWSVGDTWVSIGEAPSSFTPRLACVHRGLDAPSLAFLTVRCCTNHTY
ncbi:hypothetical protein [Halomicrococcus gelatinilyticus]|uniref:hypothetical protein n=1 Tax=Halomicrococcus gelatinilyticus TaxID=1702103 RepID=UPI002E14EE07